MAETEKLSFIGVGRLGICAALGFESKGCKVSGMDLNKDYVAQLEARTFCSQEPRVSEMLKTSNNFSVTTKLVDAVEFADIIFVFVDTPSLPGQKSYDHSKLSEVLMQINDLKVRDKHIVINSTVLPGYVAQIGRYLLQDCSNTSLSYNPYFVAQGDIMRGFFSPDMILIGEGNKEIGSRLEKLYISACDNTPHIARMSPESAEIAKLALNCYITTKISFSNMIGDIADMTEGADKVAIMKALGYDSRIGPKYSSPGYGYGGPCFPRDNRALGNYAMSVGITPLVSKAADEYNAFHADFMIKQLLAENRESYVFESVTFKDNCPVPIIEESQKLLVAYSLAKNFHKRVIIKDRGIVVKNVKKEYGSIFEYEITDPEPAMKQ